MLLKTETGGVALQGSWCVGGQRERTAQVNEEAQRPVKWASVLMAVKATSSNDRGKGEEKAQPSSKMFSG